MKPRKSDSPWQITPKVLNSRSLWPLVEGCKFEKLKKSRTIAQNGLASLADFVGAQQFSRNIEKACFLWIRFFQWNNRPPGTQLEISDRMMGISLFSIFFWHVVRFSKKTRIADWGHKFQKAQEMAPVGPTFLVTDWLQRPPGTPDCGLKNPTIRIADCG